MSDLQGEIAHLNNLRSTSVKRRRWLEEQLAMHGQLNAPVHILMDLENTRDKILKIDEQLASLGEYSHFSIQIDLLERISKLEAEMEQIKVQINSTTNRDSRMLQVVKWFWTDEQENIHIHNRIFPRYGPSGITGSRLSSIDDIPDTYHFISSLDGSKGVLLKRPEHWLPFGGRIGVEEDLWQKSQFFVYDANNEEAIYASDANRFVHADPIFCPVGNRLAYAYCHNWRASILEVDNHRYDTVDWDETFCLLDLVTWEERALHTQEVTHGYGEWATPINFLDLAFIHGGKILYAVSATERGITQVWHIQLDDGSVSVIPNPNW